MLIPPRSRPCHRTQPRPARRPPAPRAVGRPPPPPRAPSPVPQPPHQVLHTSLHLTRLTRHRQCHGATVATRWCVSCMRSTPRLYLDSRPSLSSSRCRAASAHGTRRSEAHALPTPLLPSFSRPFSLKRGLTQVATGQAGRDPRWPPFYVSALMSLCCVCLSACCSPPRRHCWARHPATMLPSSTSQYCRNPVVPDTLKAAPACIRCCGVAPCHLTGGILQEGRRGTLPEQIHARPC
jgi:hypothetical protein